jgi:hypothetical protein
MKLYLISQMDNQDYDSYDSVVVAAPDEETAKVMHPDGGDYYPIIITDWDAYAGIWVDSPDKVTVEYIGEAKEGTKMGVILASFNAG